MTVKALDSSNNVIPEANGKSITLAITCSISPCSGTKISPLTSSIVLVSGEGSVADVLILSSGIFKFEVSYGDWTSFSITTGFITNKVKTLTTSGLTDLTTFFNFDVTLTLKGDDDLNFIQTATITITDTNLGLTGTKQAPNSSGTVTFSNLYYTLNGSYAWTLTGITFLTSQPSITGTVTRSLIQIDSTPSVIPI